MNARRAFKSRMGSRYGEILADKTGRGGTWIGLVLLATVTALSELATGVSAVTVAAAPDIAVGADPVARVETACSIRILRDDDDRHRDRRTARSPAWTALE